MACLRLKPGGPMRKFCHNPSIMPSILSAAVDALRGEPALAASPSHSDNSFPEKA